MVLELASLIVATISAIINGAPIFAKLWTKLKSLFGSQHRLRTSSQHTLEAALRPLLLQNSLLRREAEQFYVNGVGAMSSYTAPAAPYGNYQSANADQWSCWDANDEAGWDV